jgi:hypothetical protein
MMRPNSVLYIPLSQVKVSKPSSEPIGLNLTIPELIDEYDRAQTEYDEALERAFTEKDANKLLKLTDEQCRLYARKAIRRAGFKGLQTYEWLLSAKIKKG